MSLIKIETELEKISQNPNNKNFIYDFLLSYDQPKSTINRLKKGDYDLSKNDNELIWKKKIYFNEVYQDDVHDVIDEISKSDEIVKHKIRFVIVTNFKTFLAIDIKTKETLDIEFNKLHKSAHFFLPLIGQEKAETITENLADIKAAEKMGKLYDLIVKDNKELLKHGRDRHGINIFFTRILFCFFAEDSGIFDSGLFTKSIISHTNENGSDLDEYLEKVFLSLNTNDKKNLSENLKLFPYVNGGLFKNKYKIPKFSRESRKILIENGSLDWFLINPDILGSMMQAVVHTGQRSELGMHYTSVQNILKLVGPLFLDDLNEEFTQAGDDLKKNNKLLKKIYNLIFLDPACGSGNFLVIVFKELCKLEIQIFKRLRNLDPNSWLIMKSGIRLDQFYGIEIDDYAHETAKLSMWIAEHQMNLFFKEVLGDSKPTLPLSLEANITKANAARIDWNQICPIKENKKVLIFGNPPYLTYGKRNEDQKEDMKLVFGSSSKLDYISIWFVKASNYIVGKNSKFAFVSTNSINQGEQVPMLWKDIFSLNLEITFCHKSFKWSNVAKNKAGVTCSIIGVSNRNNFDKKIYEDNIFKKVKEINAYLLPASNYFIEKRKKPISELPPMTLGDMPVDNGNLLLSDLEKNELISIEKDSNKFIRKFIGADEFLNNINKWCLWINDKDYSIANDVSLLKKRFDKVKEYRLKSKKKATKNYASKPHRFMEVRKQYHQSIFIPRVTSEKREYLPIGFADKDTIVGDTNSVVYDAPIYLFGVISSKVHLIWTRALAGRLETRLRYSSDIVYNNFPFPSINDYQIKKIEDISLNILDEREKFSEKKLVEIYTSMPKKLRDLHLKLDQAVENCYDFGKNDNDEDKLKNLFELHKKMLKKETLL